MYLKNRSRAKIKLQYYRCQEYSFNARSLEFKNYFVPPAEHKDINIEIDNYIETAKIQTKIFKQGKKGSQEINDREK